MFSDSVHTGFLTALAEKRTGPRTKQFSCQPLLEITPISH